MIPFSAKEDEIYNYFNKYGDIIDLRAITENYENMTLSVNIRYRTLDSVNSIIEDSNNEELIFMVGL